jgi:hypothetical protein
MRGFERDVAGKGAGANGIKKGVDLERVAACNKLHPTIGEVCNSAGDLKLAGEVFDGVSEADALHAAFVVDAEGFHGLTTEDTEKEGEEMLEEWVFIS